MPLLTARRVQGKECTNYIHATDPFLELQNLEFLEIIRQWGGSESGVKVIKDALLVQPLIHKGFKIHNPAIRQGSK